MEITSEFYDCMNKLKQFNQNIKNIECESKSLKSNLTNERHKILSNSNKVCSEFSKKIKELVSEITNMKIFLDKHRKDYVNI